MDIYPLADGLPSIPDNLTIPQFMFDVSHEIRPKRRKEIPWLIQDESGDKISEDQVHLAYLSILEQQVDPGLLMCS